jgi:FAD/FMN-containing dehydrogenase
VRPGDSAWPDAARWEELNDDVGGNLLVPQALFGSCAADPNGSSCRDAFDHIRNPYWIGDQPAGTEVSGWLDAWTPAPSAYAIRARNAADVARGVIFARAHNLRLVVKGGSHSYLGTSNAPDSLLIWTRAMRKVTLHDAFVGAGCEGAAAPVPAVSAEAGAVWMDLYTAVTTEAGRYVQGGGCTTVGVAGLVQSGGFGSFSKGFGTVAAGLLEAEIVMANGRVSIVNECNDPDLFWALKGGGGGTFGVVTRVTLRTHDLPAFFGFAGGTITAASEAAFAELIARFVDFYGDDLLNRHWGEQVTLAPDNTLGISMVCQGLDNSEAQDAWRPFFDWVRSSGDLLVTTPLRTGAEDARSWWQVDDSMIPDTRPGAPESRGWWQGDQGQVGAFIHGYDSLWLPASLLEPDRRRVLAAALFAASRHKTVQLHFNKGLAGAPPEAIAAARETATNPAAFDAFALAIVADGEGAAYPGVAGAAVDLAAARKNASAIGLAAAKLREIEPNAGSYVSESNYFNRSWQSAYWGPNYSRLRTIKDRYDPDGLFIVHHGVGSEDWSADGFTRIE